VSAIRIAEKNARLVRDTLVEAEDWLNHHSGWETNTGARLVLARIRAAAELMRPLLARRPIKPMKVERLKRGVSKREQKNAETSAIYAEVEKRADGKCEACGRLFSPSDPPELDHALGRGKVAQSVRNTWLIHRSCHRARHAGRPSSAYWHGLFAVHCDRHGYRREAADARAKFEADNLVEQAAKVSKVFHEGQPPHGSTSPASEVRSGHEASAQRGASSDASVRAARPHASRTAGPAAGAKALSPSGRRQSGVSRAE
jgi:hypothetical protein